MKKLILITALLLNTAYAKKASHPLLDKTHAKISKIIGFSDSGKPITKKYLEECINEKTSTYLKLSCNDLTFDHYLVSFKAKNGGHIYFMIEDGASVENRYLWKTLKDDNNEMLKQYWPKMDDAKIAALINKKTGKKSITAEAISASAQSSYRTRLPKDGTNFISVYPGDFNGVGDIGEIAKIEWDGKAFVLKN